MEEKILLKGDLISKIKILLTSISASVVSLIIGLILMELATVVFSRSHSYDVAWELCGNLSVIFYVLAAILFVAGLIVFFCWGNVELTVTDKRIYGKAAFGKRVDLPLDMISAVGTSWLKGIDVGTSSGRIKFKFVNNQDEIHSVLSKLLMERQQAERKNITPQPVVSASNADELKKFKDLLDSGVITQEEFDAKKKQLLGL